MENKSYVDKYQITKIPLFNRETGLPEPVIVTREEQPSTLQTAIQLFTQDYDRIGAGSLYDTRSHVKLASLWTDNDGIAASKFKGIGTALVRQVCKESVNLGHEGQVSVTAHNCKQGSVGGSPTPFYFKLGFRFWLPQNNKRMEDYLSGVVKDLPQDLNVGLMTLEGKNALDLLG